MTYHCAGLPKEPLKTLSKHQVSQLNAINKEKLIYEYQYGVK